MRPEVLNPLFAETEALKGVGPQLMKPLKKLGLTRVIDLLFHLPTGYVDRKRVDRLYEDDVGRVVTVPLTATEYRSAGGPRSPLRISAFDPGGDHVTLVYFRNGRYARELHPLGEQRIVSGRLDRYGQELQMVHPDHVLAPGEAATLPTREAIYPLSEGLTGRRLAEFIQQAIARVPDVGEWIEPSLLAHHEWPGFAEALQRIHTDPADQIARARLAYDEVFANQLALALVRLSSRRQRGVPLVGDGAIRARLKLPYIPTGAQTRSIGEIEGDMAQATPMLRLLQGDVGAGKTLVALNAMLIAVEAGAQAAMLAPTEILARQHFDTLSRQLAGTGVNIAVLTGRDKGRPREATLMGLADGSIHILVGTHAIFQEAVNYKRLGLVVIDEQHRFGVAQRMMLTAKAERAPHLLVMTATPIPRTLELTQHGELDVSRLDEMPPGRQPIRTTLMNAERLGEVVDALARHIGADKQAYWVCPLVEESEKSDLAAAEERAAQLQQRFGGAIGLIHGRMAGPEKDAVMARFQAGEIKVLVATVVIEVGVDVPNATLIVIEHADRFGLAQLHQLRGRVGRGSGQSFCILLYGSADGNPGGGKGLSETSRARLALMRETNDGFRIAEMDLELRGAGELLGTRQSGDAVFRLAGDEGLKELVATADSDARLLIDRDGGLASARGEAARLLLYIMERDAAVATLRSG